MNRNFRDMLVVFLLLIVGLVVMFRRKSVMPAVSEIVKKITHITVPPESIHISSSKVILNGISQAARSEIFIKREVILKEINLVSGKVKMTEIR